MIQYCKMKKLKTYLLKRIGANKNEDNIYSVIESYTKDDAEEMAQSLKCKVIKRLSNPYIYLSTRGILINNRTKEAKINIFISKARKLVMENVSSYDFNCMNWKVPASFDEKLRKELEKII